MKSIIFAMLSAAVLFAAPVAFAASDSSDLKITKDGKIIATNLSVIQKSDSTLFVRALWEGAFLRIVVTTSSSTDIRKNHGEKATVADIESGHTIDAEGALSSGGDGITFSASKIRDTALLRESKTFSGLIKSVDAQSQSFVLPDKSLGDVTVVVSSTVVMTQGKRQATFADVKKGLRVLSVVGSYDYATKILTPTSIELFQDKSVFAAKNFQGALKSVSGTALPAQITVSVDDKEYTVYLSEKTAVLSKNKAATTLNRFAVGDIVRIFGKIRETNLLEIDAEVARDLNF